MRVRYDESAYCECALMRVCGVYVYNSASYPEEQIPKEE